MAHQNGEGVALRIDEVGGRDRDDHHTRAQIIDLDLSTSRSQVSGLTSSSVNLPATAIANKESATPTIHSATVPLQCLEGTEKELPGESSSTAPSS